MPAARRLTRAVLLGTLGVALLGCATPQPPLPEPVASTESVSLQGQLSIKLAAWLDQPARGISAGYFFEGDERSGRIDLMTPLGSQMARVVWQPGRVWLEDGRERREFESLDALSESLFGEALPLRALPWWMQGKPTPALPHQADTGTFGQAGWRIDTRAVNEGRITAERPGSSGQRPVTIRIVSDR
ncbi:hypothetical protein DEH84_10810 [Aquabacterium olei]|uniref:Outer-membrane lipoprotein LolB n=2 Tax=Aquabacterium olei TaxID=1296669 RepID=A0A2U8FS39_9BURK|nr:hypothetical protein DEH84_10810 [Aquabacterium olei]